MVSLLNKELRCPVVSSSRQPQSECKWLFNFATNSNARCEQTFERLYSYLVKGFFNNLVWVESWNVSNGIRVAIESNNTIRERYTKMNKQTGLHNFTSKKYDKR
jgi:hypothetical protein